MNVRPVLYAGLAIVPLLPVACVLFLSGFACLLLRIAYLAMEWLHNRCREFFLYIESWARRA